MAKTCRTCAALGGYCEATGQVFLGPIPAFIHIATAYTPSPRPLFVQAVESRDDCPHWSKRETPLLADALAKALERLVDLHDASVYRPHSSWLEAIEHARIILARHQKEVRNAQK